MAGNRVPETTTTTYHVTQNIAALMGNGPTGSHGRLVQTPAERDI